jgi:hypothetical protein
VFAGASAALLLHPLDLVKIRFQVNDGSLATIRYRGILDAFRTILRVEGVQGLFKGGLTGVSPNGLPPAGKRGCVTVYVCACCVAAAVR